jgi:hypothetical protein
VCDKQRLEEKIKRKNTEQEIFPQKDNSQDKNIKQLTKEESVLFACYLSSHSSSKASAFVLSPPQPSQPSSPFVIESQDEIKKESIGDNNNWLINENVSHRMVTEEHVDNKPDFFITNPNIKIADVSSPSCETLPLPHSVFVASPTSQSISLPENNDLPTIVNTPPLVTTSIDSFSSTKDRAKMLDQLNLHLTSPLVFYLGKKLFFYFNKNTIITLIFFYSPGFFLRRGAFIMPQDI